MLLLLTCLAFAADPAPPTAPVGAAPAPAEAPATDSADSVGDAPDSPPDVALPTLEDRIDEAITLRRRGNLDGARALLVALEPLVPVDQLPWYLYQRGICEELGWHPEAALAFYDQVIATAGDAALDARFRRVLVLEDMGMQVAALEEVRGIDRAAGLSVDDEITIALERGVAELGAGKRTAGIRRIQKALDATEGGDSHRYLRAKARWALARALLEEADGLALTGSEKRVVKRLGARATRIKAAEQQIIALTTLQEPEWVLASLVSLGDSYARLGADLLASPAPRKLDATQVEMYRTELAKRAENVRTKAFHAYDQGVTLATRLAWESPRVDTLKERRAGFAAER